MTLRFTLALALTGAIACKGDPDPAPEADTDTDTDADSDADTDADTDADSDADTDTDTDTEPPPVPAVLSTLPDQGDEGVLPDATITLVFSQPMDAASVEAALAIPLLGTAYTTSWPDAATLVVTPDAPLPVLAADVVVRGQEVTVALGEGAMSQAGAALASDPDLLAFRVARSWSGTVDDADFLSGRVGSIGVATMNTMTVGDTFEGVTFRALATFDLVGIPPIVAVNQASVTLELEGVVGDPFTALGDLSIEAVEYNVLNAAAYDSAPISSSVVGHVPEVLGGYTVDVTPVVEEVVQDPDATRAQLRFAFTSATDGDGGNDQVEFAATGDRPSLALDVLVE